MRLAFDPRDLKLEALGQGNVVRIQTGDVATGCTLQAPVQRRGEAEPLVVPEDDHARIGNRRQRPRRLVRRRVVDHDQLEVAKRLTQHALNGETDVTRLVVSGQQDGNERHGR